MSCAIISLFVLMSYVVGVCLTQGLPHSLSQTFFSIRHKWIFSAVMAFSFGMMFAPLMAALPYQCQCLGFLTVAGGIVIAFAPNLNDRLEESVHMTGAIIMGVASQAVVAVLRPELLGLWLMWLVVIPLKQRVFFAEMIGGAALYLALLSDCLYY